MPNASQFWHESKHRTHLRNTSQNDLLLVAMETLLVPALLSNRPFTRTLQACRQSGSIYTRGEKTKTASINKDSKQQVSLSKDQVCHLLRVKIGYPVTFSFETVHMGSQPSVLAADAAQGADGRRANTWASLVVGRVSAVVLSIQGKFALPIPLH